VVVTTAAVHRTGIVTDPERLRAVLSGFGPFAPLAFVVLQAAQVLVAPIPGPALALAAGYLFGWQLGTLYSMIGVTIGSALAITIARRFGRPAVERFVAPHALARFDDFLDARGQIGLFVVFLFPGFPDDVLCFIAGLTDVPVRRLVLLVAVARTPAFLVVAVAGERAATDLVGASVILAVLTLVAALGYAYRDRLPVGGEQASRPSR
jgi:uncharacterized membrane protein YdjX (TVP38/TMEM64 family)